MRSFRLGEKEGTDWRRRGIGALDKKKRFKERKQVEFPFSSEESPEQGKDWKKNR